MLTTRLDLTPLQKLPQLIVSYAEPGHLPEWRCRAAQASKYKIFGLIFHQNDRKGFTAIADRSRAPE
jgi:hypothetical protein